MVKVEIVELEDEWFIIRIIHEKTGLGIITYKCDQFEGLIKFFEYYGMIG